MALTRTELQQVKYINYDYRVELSGGFRLATDAARRIQAGVEVFRVSSGGVLAVADAVAAGMVFPELILVSAGEDGARIVLEGHIRLTAYLLRSDHLPPEVEVLIGYSPELVRWDLY